MRMLFINQFFWPDSSATSQQLTDLVSALAARGVDVAVLCGDGGYAAAAGAQVLRDGGNAVDSAGSSPICLSI